LVRGKWSNKKTIQRWKSSILYSDEDDDDQQLNELILNTIVGDYNGGVKISELKTICYLWKDRDGRCRLLLEDEKSKTEGLLNILPGDYDAEGHRSKVTRDE
jgi:hypothetical protein